MTESETYALAVRDAKEDDIARGFTAEVSVTNDVIEEASPILGWAKGVRFQKALERLEKSYAYVKTLKLNS